MHTLYLTIFFVVVIVLIIVPSALSVVSHDCHLCMIVPGQVPCYIDIVFNIMPHKRKQCFITGPAYIYD